MLGFLIFLLFVALLGLPVAAFVLALVNRSKVQSLRRRLDTSDQQWRSSLIRIDVLAKRIRALEEGPTRAAPEKPAEEPVPAEPVAADEEPPKPAAPEPAVEPHVPAPAPVAAGTGPPVEKPAPVSPSPEPAVVPLPGQPAASRRAGFERQLGTRLAVWLGAVALALAGAFLVKYTFDNNLLGPAVRVTLGLVFGVGMLLGAEWLRQRVSGVAQGLSAAGVAVLYASLLAGVNLYHLISPTFGFLGMALVTATAVVLALRHGQIVAIIGLLGGFLTPAWIGTGVTRPWMLLVYLLLLQTGLLSVSRTRRWWPVTGLTLVGAMGWAIVWMAGLDRMGGDTTPIGLLLLVTVISFVVVATRGAKRDEAGDRALPELLIWAAAGSGVILMAALVGVGKFGLSEWGFFALLGAGALFLGIRESRFEGLAWLAALAGTGLLFFWGIGLDPGSVHRFWLVTLGLTALYIGGSYLAVWLGRHPERWAVLSATSGVLYLLVAYQGLHALDFPIPWGIQSLVLAGLFVAFAVPVARRRETLESGELTLAALAVAVTVFISLAIPMELERAWITVAWAIEIPALAWLAGRLRIPTLEKLALTMGGVVAVRLLLNPFVLGYPIGAAPVLNWLLYGYGIPIVAFAIGSVLFRRLGKERTADILEIGAVVFGFALTVLEVRQYFHPGDIGAAHFELAELGALTIVGLLFGLGLLRLLEATGRPHHATLAVVFSTLALAQGIFIQGLLANPVISGFNVGETPIFNTILFAYGVPTALAAVLALAFGRRGETVIARSLGCASLILAFITVTLEVRQAFHGGALHMGGLPNSEMYTYSLVWIVFATALLVAGIATRGVVLRYGSAAVMAIAVGKVFLVDAASLQDLYRVFSFLGLGVSLMVLAYLYQKFVFGERRS